MGEHLAREFVLHVGALTRFLAPCTANKAVQPRPVNATSLPSLIGIFQGEWDAMVSESFELRKQLDQVRQELSHTLYQHDAACRVIAKLIKERDEARAALANPAGMCCCCASQGTLSTRSKLVLGASRVPRHRSSVSAGLARVSVLSCGPGTWSQDLVLFLVAGGLLGDQRALP